MHAAAHGWSWWPAQVKRANCFCAFGSRLISDNDGYIVDEQGAITFQPIAPDDIPGNTWTVAVAVDDRLGLNNLSPKSAISGHKKCKWDLINFFKFTHFADNLPPHYPTSPSSSYMRGVSFSGKFPATPRRGSCVLRRGKPIFIKLCMEKPHTQLRLSRPTAIIYATYSHL